MRQKARIPFLRLYSSNALFLSLIVSGLPAAARFSLVGLCNAAALLTGPFGVILLLLLAATLLGRILSLLRVLTLSHNHCETSTGFSLPLLVRFIRGGRGCHRGREARGPIA
jgi:hypothetical protein